MQEITREGIERLLKVARRAYVDAVANMKYAATTGSDSLVLAAQDALGVAWSAKGKAESASRYFDPLLCEMCGTYFSTDEYSLGDECPNCRVKMIATTVRWY